MDKQSKRWLKILYDMIYCKWSKYNNDFYCKKMTFPSIMPEKLYYIPDKIEYISIRTYPYDFNKYFKANMPKNLQYISIERDNSIIDKLTNLPNLLSVYLSDGFNQSIDNLPDSVRFILIDTVYFDQPINKLPKSLRVLRFFFSARYCHPINISHNKLRHLTLQAYKNIKITLNCPKLKILRLYDDFSFVEIPLTVKYLYTCRPIVCLHKFIRWYSFSYQYMHENISYYYLWCIRGPYKKVGRQNINIHNHNIKNTKLIDLLLKN